MLIYLTIISHFFKKAIETYYDIPYIFTFKSTKYQYIKRINKLLYADNIFGVIK